VASTCRHIALLYIDEHIVAQEAGVVRAWTSKRIFLSIPDYMLYKIPPVSILEVSIILVETGELHTKKAVMQEAFDAP